MVIFIKKIFTLIASLVFFASIQCQSQSMEMISSSAVLIESSKGHSGSGVIVSYNQYVYLITAKHVLFDFQKPGMPLIDDWQTVTFYSGALNAAHKVRMRIWVSALFEHQEIRNHPAADLSIIRLALFKDNKGNLQYNDNGIKIENLKGAIASVRLEDGRIYNQVELGNGIYCVGYPKSIGFADNPQYDYNLPLLMNGIISGKNDALQTIVLQCGINPGNSGGPVFEVVNEQGQLMARLCGIITQYIPIVQKTLANTPNEKSTPFLNKSGFSVAEPIDKAIEIIKQYPRD